MLFHIPVVLLARLSTANMMNSVIMTRMKAYSIVVAPRSQRSDVKQPMIFLSARIGSPVRYRQSPTDM